MDALNARFDALQEKQLDLYEKDPETLEEAIELWDLVRRENVLMHYARKTGRTRLGLQPLPTLQVSEAQAKKAIQMQLYLTSLQNTEYANEKWTLQDTSEMTFMSDPSFCFKKQPRPVKVVFDGEPENALRHTLWLYIYYQDDDDKWHKTKSDVDINGIFYDVNGDKVYYQDFRKDARRYSMYGQWEVTYNNKTFSSSIVSSSGAEADSTERRPPLQEERPAPPGKRRRVSESPDWCPQAVAQETYNRAFRPCGSESPASSRSRSRTRSRTRSKSRSQSRSRTRTCSRGRRGTRSQSRQTTRRTRSRSRSRRRRGRGRGRGGRGRSPTRRGIHTRSQSRSTGGPRLRVISAGPSSSRSPSRQRGEPSSLPRRSSTSLRRSGGQAENTEKDLVDTTQSPPILSPWFGNKTSTPHKTHSGGSGRRSPGPATGAEPQVAGRKRGRPRSDSRLHTTQVDPPVILVRGQPNQLKCWRYRLHHRRKRIRFKFLSTTFSWATRKLGDRLALSRMLVAFDNDSDRETFLKNVHFPIGVTYSLGNFDGL